MLLNKVRQPTVALCIFSVLTACSTPSAIKVDQNPPTIKQKDYWNTETFGSNQSENKVNQHNSAWLHEIITPELQQVISAALESNHSLKQSFYALQSTKQSIIANGASFWPSLDLSFNSGRSHNSISDISSNSSGLSLSAKYELDVWGKLSSYEQQLNLSYSAQLASYQQEKNGLIKDVVIAWFQVVESTQQLILFKQRYNNVKQNLAVIESGYESGLNSALDVYLSRNEAANENTNVLNQQTALKGDIRNLELLIGEYPSGQMNVSTKRLPIFSANIALNLPSDVVTNNPEIKNKWMNLLSKDAALAFSHKQRFPSISFTASTGYASDELSDLLSNNLGWSLFGNITAPIFNAGKLKANEEAARYNVKEVEQAYLETLFSVFSNIENQITKTQNLHLRFNSSQSAAESSALAEQISFEQYLKGLVSYTTVLDAQSRAFNAQSSLINLTLQILDNQLELFTNIGGDFSALLPLSSEPKIENSNVE